MEPPPRSTARTLSVIIPCFNEQQTLKCCLERVLAIADGALALQIIIVDDGSTDQSLSVARELAQAHPEVSVLRHERNQGKGAALRTGFQKAAGDYVAVQDADLEYDPTDLRRLVTLLMNGEADVVLGSRFLSTGAHRVLYFWHSVGNRVLTLLSNMYTDLNLTDMECGYKVFRREVIQRITIEENRFGFEPEIVAKTAAMRLRIYEMGISYHGRTYAEGKKIGVKDGIRALYCICRYNAHRAPLPMQFLLYVVIGGLAAVVNLAVFLALFSAGWGVPAAAPAAFVTAAVVNYWLCVSLLFRHRARWTSPLELGVFLGVVCAVGTLDLLITRWLLELGVAPGLGKLAATAVGLVLNFAGRRFLVFPEPTPAPWK
jgi:glycosyltransferase involved in cell wall biosynthesis